MDNENKIVELLNEINNRLNDIDRNQAVIEKEIKELSFDRIQMHNNARKTEKSLAVIERELNSVKETAQVLEHELNSVKETTQVLERGLQSVKETAEANHNSLLNIELTHLPKIQAALDVAADSNVRMTDHEKRITFMEDEIKLIRATI